MRQIKFRGKRPNSGKWITGSLVQLFGFSYILNDEHKTSDCSTEVIPETVSQFTGLTDKNGKEIYEGDILGRLFDSYNENTIVVYNKGILCARPISKEDYRTLNTFDSCGWVRVDKGGSYNFQIIGNIHDNPELLNEKQ